MEDVQITIAMGVFKRHKKPAASFEDSDEQLSTQDILDVFHDLMGEDVMDHEMMFDLLTTHGFIYDLVMGNFRWLINTQVNNS